MGPVVLGFLLGVLSSLLAAPLVWWATRVLPRRLVVRAAAVATHPLLPVKLGRQEVRHARAVVGRLFTAWATRDRALYLSCWHPDAVRTQRRSGRDREPQKLDEIARGFDRSCLRYSQIRVPWWTVEDAAVHGEFGVVLSVAYEMALVREEDGILFVEEGREQYRLAVVDGRWAIASNYDTFSYDHSIHERSGP